MWMKFRHVIFKQILMIDGSGISCEIALIWMSLDFTDDQSTLVPVMAWCRQATSHYLSQCWPRSLSQYGVTRPQWLTLAWCSFFLVFHGAIKDIQGFGTHMHHFRNENCFSWHICSTRQGWVNKIYFPNHIIVSVMSEASSSLIWK